MFRERLFLYIFYGDKLKSLGLAVQRSNASMAKCQQPRRLACWEPPTPAKNYVIYIILSYPNLYENTIFLKEWKNLKLIWMYQRYSVNFNSSV